MAGLVEGNDEEVTASICQALKLRPRVASTILAYLVNDVMIGAETRRWDGIVKSVDESSSSSVIHSPDIALVYGHDVHADSLGEHAVGAEVSFLLKMKDGTPYAQALDIATSKVSPLAMVPPCVALRQQLQESQSALENGLSRSTSSAKRRRVSVDKGTPMTQFVSMFNAMMTGSHVVQPRPKREFEEVKAEPKDIMGEANKRMMELMGSLASPNAASLEARSAASSVSSAEAPQPAPPPPPPPAEPIDMMAEANRKMMEIMGMSGQGKSMPADYVPRLGDWRCLRCDSFVFAKKTACPSCGTSNPSPPGEASESSAEAGTRPGDWQCNSCNRMNFSQRTACKHCGAARGNVARLNAKPGDWICPSCGDLVFSSRDGCKMCGTPKPLDADPLPSAATAVRTPVVIQPHAQPVVIPPPGQPVVIPAPPPPPGQPVVIAPASRFAALTGTASGQLQQAQLQQVQAAQAAQAAQMAQLRALAGMGLAGDP